MIMVTECTIYGPNLALNKPTLESIGDEDPTLHGSANGVDGNNMTYSHTEYQWIGFRNYWWAVNITKRCCHNYYIRMYAMVNVNGQYPERLGKLVISVREQFLNPDPSVKDQWPAYDDASITPCHTTAAGGGLVINFPCNITNQPGLIFFIQSKNDAIDGYAEGLVNFAEFELYCAEWDYFSMSNQQYLSSSTSCCLEWEDSVLPKVVNLTDNNGNTCVQMQVSISCFVCFFRIVFCNINKFYERKNIALKYCIETNFHII